MSSEQQELSIDIDRYQELPEPLRHEFDWWLEQEGLKDERIRAFRLLEGAIQAERYVLNTEGRIHVDVTGERAVTETIVFPISTAPPKEALTR